MPHNFRFYWEEPFERKEPNFSIEVPGFKKDEINVSLASNSITIVASKKDRKVHSSAYHYSEESFSSSFTKTMALPHEINPANFEIIVRDGKVTLKRRKKSKKMV